MNTKVRTSFFRNNIDAVLFRKMGDSIGGNRVYISTCKSERVKERNQAMFYDFLHGVDYYALSEKYNLGLSTVYKAIRECRDSEAIKEYEAGVTYKEVMRKYGIRPTHLNKIINSMNGGVSDEQ